MAANARPRPQLRFSPLDPRAGRKNTAPVARQPRRLAAQQAAQQATAPALAATARENPLMRAMQQANQAEASHRVKRGIRLTDSDSIDDARPATRNHAERSDAALSLRAYFKETRRLSDQAGLFNSPGKMIAHVFQDLYLDPDYPAPAADNAWTAVDCPHADQLQQLLSHVVDEEIAPASRMPMLRGLLQRLVDPETSRPFMIAGYDFLTGARMMQTVSQVREGFETHLLAKFPALDKTPGAAHWLACQLLQRFDPEMLSPKLEAFWYGGGQYCALKADIDVIRSANLYNPHWDLKEISDTATSVRESLAEDGIPSADVAILQRDAALLYAHAKYNLAEKTHLIDLRESLTAEDYAIALQALEDLQTARRLWQFAPLQEAIANLKAAPPMRSKIAERLLRENGIDPFADIAPQLGVDLCAGQRDTPVKFYMNGCIDSLRDRQTFDARDTLPDLDQAYETEFTAWHQKYQSALAVLLWYAVEELPPKEYRFLRENPHVLLQAKMTATKRIAHVAPTFSGDPSVTKDVSLAGGKGLLFLAENGKERRYYLISLADDNAAIVRRVQPPKGDIGAYIQQHRNTFFEPAALAETVDDALTTSASVRQLAACPAHDAAGCFEKTARQMASLIREEVHDFGYETTGHQETLEGIQNFLLGLIPGYDCASAVNDGDYEEAILPCIDTAAAVMPLIGRFGQFGMALAGTATKASAYVATREFGKILVQQGLLRAAGALGTRVQPELAKIGGRFARKLGQDLLEFGDPGVVLTYEAFGQARKLGSLAQRLLEDARARKLRKMLYRNPHTRHAARRFKKLQRQGRTVLRTQYEGKLSSDAGGRFRRFTLPHGAKVQPRPYLKYQAPYNALGDDFDYYEINDVIYAYNADPGKRPHVLEKAEGLLGRCRTRRGLGNACLSVEMLPTRSREQAALGTGYRFDAGKSQTRLCQIDPATKRKTFMVPTVEGYPVPRMVGGSTLQILLTLRDAYLMQATPKGLRAKAIDTSYPKYALEAPDAQWPAMGKIVSGRASESLKRIEFELENGVHKCTIRAAYGSYLAPDGHHGMIRFDDEYIRVDFPEGAGDGTVALAEATAAEIDAYQRFQIESLAAQDRRTSKTFSMELSHTGAGSLLRLYRNYNLEPYQALLEKIAGQGKDRLRAAEMLDAYLEFRQPPPDIGQFTQIKSIFNELLQDQFGNVDKVRKFQQHLTEAVARDNERLDLHWLDPATPALDEMLGMLTTLFPGTASATGRYKASLAPHVDASEKRLAFSKLRHKFWGKNFAWAEEFLIENDIPALEHIFFSISGKPETSKKKAHGKIPTIASDKKFIHADEVIARFDNRPGDHPSRSFPDFKATGAQQWRGHDAELKIVTAFRHVLEELQESGNKAITLKMVSMLPPCVMCLQAIAMLLEEFPNVKIELAYLKPHRAEAASRSRRGISRARRAKTAGQHGYANGWPLRHGRPKPPAGAASRHLKGRRHIASGLTPSGLA
ncbi:MAG TPA: hypothetical protein VGN04_09440 [Herbaspirillum sp.]|jgi:hypothetical protein